MACFLTHPTLLTSEIETKRGKPLPLQVYIAETYFTLLKYRKKEIIEESFCLPSKPTSIPDWKYTMTFPIRMQEEQAILFRSGNFHFAWLIKEKVPLLWYETDVPITKEILLASIPNNPTPHRRYLLELLAAEENHKSVPKENYWPLFFHYSWLEILTETKASEDMDQNDLKTSLLVSSNKEELNSLIKKLQRGTIISMAQRSKKELQMAKTLLIEKTKKTPKDKTWVSLLEILT